MKYDNINGITGVWETSRVFSRSEKASKRLEIIRDFARNPKIIRYRYKSPFVLPEWKAERGAKTRENVIVGEKNKSLTNGRIRRVLRTAK